MIGVSVFVLTGTATQERVAPHTAWFAEQDRIAPLPPVFARFTGIDALTADAARYAALARVGPGPLVVTLDTWPAGQAPVPAEAHAEERPELTAEPESRAASAGSDAAGSASTPKTSSSGSSSSSSSAGWSWPITGQITQGFGSDHRGIDILADYGDAVRAAHAGRVTEVGYLNSCGGLEIRMDIGGGIDTRYMHLSDEMVAVGDSIARGEVIGRVGESGCATGPHLHFGVRVDGTFVDPLRYLPAR